MKKILSLVVCAAISGCTAYTEPRPAQYYDTLVSPSEAATSLFSSDSEVLSDEDIARILEYQYAAPSLSRIAVLPFGWNSWSGWSDEMALATDDANQKLLRRLVASAQIYDASFLPSILVPEKRTVPYLREAAARYQADLLLVFRSACGSFTKFRFFASDKVRSYCNVEAILLDVRTGLVPFTAVATRNFDTEKTDEDLNLQEATLRSQLSAIADALEEVSVGIVEFLESSGEPVG